MNLGPCQALDHHADIFSLDLFGAAKIRSSSGGPIEESNRLFVNLSFPRFRGMSDFEEEEEKSKRLRLFAKKDEARKKASVTSFVF